MRRLGIHIAALFTAIAASGACFVGSASAQSIGPYMVFFDPGAADLGNDSRAILDNAATAYLAVSDEGPILMLAGHTDDTMDGGAAIGESQVRANSVRDYLVSRGVPAGVIVIEAFGATRPLVQTAKGVPEPLNRRVEITVGPGSGW